MGYDRYVGGRDERGVGGSGNPVCIQRTFREQGEKFIWADPSLPSSLPIPVLFITCFCAHVLLLILSMLKGNKIELERGGQLKSRKDRRSLELTVLEAGLKGQYKL